MADIFDVVSDPTRRALLGALLELYARPDSHNGEISVGELVEQLGLSQPTVSKHLRVLETVGVVRSIRAGRENLFELEPKPIADARHYLDEVARQWDDALGRLRSFVED